MHSLFSHLLIPQMYLFYKHCISTIWKRIWLNSFCSQRLLQLWQSTIVQDAGTIWQAGEHWHFKINIFMKYARNCYAAHFCNHDNLLHIEAGDFPKQNLFFSPPLNYYCFILLYFMLLFQEHYCLIQLTGKGQLHKQCRCWSVNQDANNMLLHSWVY